MSVGPSLDTCAIKIPWEEKKNTELYTKELIILARFYKVNRKEIATIDMEAILGGWHKHKN